jgi:hypothetical protein
VRYALAIHKLISLCTLTYLALLHSFFMDSVHTGAAYSSCGSIAPLCIALSASCFSPQLHHVTVLNTVDSCNTVVSIIIYYNIIIIIIIVSHHSSREHRALTKLLHLTQFLASTLTSFHVLPWCLISSKIVLRHVVRGLPRDLVPWGFHS